MSASSNRKSSSGRRTHRRLRASDFKGKVIRLTSSKQVKQLENIIREGPMTLVFVYSQTCPHCHTYMPIWDGLTNIKDKKTHMVSMKSDVYHELPMSKKYPIDGVPSVLYVDPTGRISEGKNIRDEKLMTTVVRNAISEDEAAVVNAGISNASYGNTTSSEPGTSNSTSTSNVRQNTAMTTSQNLQASKYFNEPSAPPLRKLEDTISTTDLYRVSEQPSTPGARVPNTEITERLRPIIPGTNVAPNPLRPIPGTPEPSTSEQSGGAYPQQHGGNPWAAFLLAAQQAAPAAALLGAYSALPKKQHRSSGLGKAVRRRTHRRHRS